MFKTIFAFACLTLISQAPTMASQEQYTQEQVDRYKAFCALRAELDAHFNGTLQAMVGNVDSPELEKSRLKNEERSAAILEHYGSQGEKGENPRSDNENGGDAVPENNGGEKDEKGVTPQDMTDLLNLANKALDWTKKYELMQKELLRYLMYFINKREEIEKDFVALTYDSIPQDVVDQFEYMKDIMGYAKREEFTDPTAKFGFLFNHMDDFVTLIPQELVARALKVTEADSGGTNSLEVGKSSRQPMSDYLWVIKTNYDFCMVRGLLAIHARGEKLDYSELLSSTKIKGVFDRDLLLKKGPYFLSEQGRLSEKISALIFDDLEKSVQRKKAADKKSKKKKSLISNRALLGISPEVKPAQIKAGQSLRTPTNEEFRASRIFQNVNQVFRLPSNNVVEDDPELLSFPGLLYACVIDKSFTEIYRVASQNLPATLKLLAESQDPAKLNLEGRIYKPLTGKELEDHLDAMDKRNREDVKKKGGAGGKNKEKAGKPAKSAGPTVIVPKAAAPVGGAPQAGRKDERVISDAKVEEKPLVVVKQAPKKEDVPLDPKKMKEKEGSLALKLEKSKSKKARLKADNEEKSRSIRELEEANKGLQLQLESLKRDSEKKEKRFSRTVSVSRNLKDQVVDLKYKVKSGDRANKRLSIQLSNADLERESLAAQIEKLSTQLTNERTALDNVRRDLNARVEAVKKDEEELRVLLLRQEQDKSQKLEQEIAKMRSTIETCRAANNSLTAEVNQKEYDYWKSSQANEMLLGRLQNSRIGELERQNRELEAKITEIGWEKGKNALLVEENTALRKTVEAQALRIQQLEALLAGKK